MSPGVYYNAAAANGLVPGAIPEVYGGGGGLGAAGVGVGGGVLGPGVVPPSAMGPGVMPPPSAGAVGWPGGVGMGMGMGPGLTNAEIAINAKQTFNGVTTRQFSRREFNDPISGFLNRRMRRRMRRLGGGPLWNGMYWG